MRDEDEIREMIREILKHPTSYVAPGYTIQVLEWVLGGRDDI
jgi:hypothetical protein